MATKLEEYLGRTSASPSEATTAEMAPLYRTEQPAPVPAPAPATPATDYAKLIADKGYYGAFQELYPKQDLTDEYKRTKKQQQMALLADIANVGSQLFASSRGARKFAPVQSNVPAYEAQMQRLRDAQRAYDADYAGKALSAAYKDYTDKQANAWKEKQLAAQREAAANKLAQDMMKFNANLTYKQAKDAADRELQKQRNAETKRHNQNMESLSRQRAEQSNANVNKVVDSAIGSDGNIYTRNSKLSDSEARQIVMSTGMNGEDLAPFVVEERDVWGNVMKSKTDWVSAAAYALQNGMVDSEELKSRGFKLGGGTRSNNDKNDDNVPPSLRRPAENNNDNVPPSMRR